MRAAGIPHDAPVQVLKTTQARAIFGPYDTSDPWSFLKILMGIFLHTRAECGPPSRAEAMGALKVGGYWTKRQRRQIVDWLVEKGQVTP